MRLLLDQDVYAATANFLVDAGYDVILVSDLGLSRASDEEILKVAQDQQRVLITRDRDYGNLVFVRGLGSGVLYLRILPSTLAATHQELVHVLEVYSAEELQRAFVVIEAGGHRIRQSPP